MEEDEWSQGQSKKSVQLKRRKKMKELEEDDRKKQQSKMRDTASYMFCFVNQRRCIYGKHPMGVMDPHGSWTSEVTALIDEV
jgi:hypothetical protein